MKNNKVDLSVAIKGPWVAILAMFPIGGVSCGKSEKIKLTVPAATSGTLAATKGNTELKEKAEPFISKNTFAANAAFKNSDNSEA